MTAPAIEHQPKVEVGPPRIRISEIFGPTIQGEGAQIGRPTVFVRTGGCDYRCKWCDTLYAVLAQYRPEWEPMMASEVMQRVRQLSPNPCVITLSGGNPALQPLEPLLDYGHAAGYTFTMETQGSAYRPWFGKLDHLCLSPKPPSSGMETNWQKLADCVNGAPDDTIVKVVVFDDDDYEYARAVGRWIDGWDLQARGAPWPPLYLQVGNATPGEAQADHAALTDKLRWLVDKVTADNWMQVRVLPQLHVQLWGNARAV